MYCDIPTIVVIVSLHVLVQIFISMTCFHPYICISVGVKDDGCLNTSHCTRNVFLCEKSSCSKQTGLHTYTHLQGYIITAIGSFILLLALGSTPNTPENRKIRLGKCSCGCYVHIESLESLFNIQCTRIKLRVSATVSLTKSLINFL